MRNKSRLRAIALSALPPIVAAALAIDIFLVDTFTPLEGAVAVLYVVVVLIAANILGRRGILLVSAACVVLAIASYVFAHGLETSSASFRLFVSIAAIVITTLLALRMKSAQSALRRSEAYLAEAQRLSLTGSFGWAIGGQELYWSEETYRILGYEPGTIPTVALVMQRVHPDDLPLVQGAIDSAKQGARDVDFVHRLRLPDGAVKFIHVIARAIGNPGKIEYVGAVMDITAATQAEKALQSEPMLRISRSCLINMNHLREVSRTPRGDFILVLNGGRTVTSSEGYREPVRAYLSRLKVGADDGVG